jgi:LmbE family N-acetylglucosaminyl deacetylase
MRKHDIISRWIDKTLSLLKGNMVYVDISDYLNLKKKALNEYKSQMTIFSTAQKRPVVDIDLEKHLRKKKEIFFVHRH